MPANRNALIRYKTIDRCLRNRYRDWTLEDLIEECSEALYEYEGIDKGVSRRTVQSDIQVMRSDKLGYNAPIIVYDKKYYAYEDPEYSITNIPLTDQDLGMLSDTVNFLRQFKDFSHFQAVGGVIQKLEDQIHSKKTQRAPVIDFEKNEFLKGLDHLDFLYQAVIDKSAVELLYQSFKARQANRIIFSPYLLKEYRNRWFVVGKMQREKEIVLLALDRIIERKRSNEAFKHDFDFDPLTYFKDTVGVTVQKKSDPIRVVLWADRKQAPYILTKPIHHSQKTLSKDAEGTTFELTAHHNFELERVILGFGAGVRVLEPRKLRNRILHEIQDCADGYDTELNPNHLQGVSQKVVHKGFTIIQPVYTRKEIRLIGAMLKSYFAEQGYTPGQKLDLLNVIPQLEAKLLTTNMKQIAETMFPRSSVTEARYVLQHIQGKTDSWSQGPDNDNKGERVVIIRIQIDDSNKGNGELQLVPSSHKKKLSKKEIDLIANNASVFECSVQSGGALIFDEQIIRKQLKPNNQKSNRCIDLVLKKGD